MQKNYDRILSKLGKRQQKECFYKSPTDQLSNLLFLANPSEHPWQSSIAFVHDGDKDRGTLAHSQPQTL